MEKNSHSHARTVVFLCFGVVLGLAACGGGSPSSASGSPPAQGTGGAAGVAGSGGSGGSGGGIADAGRPNTDAGISTTRTSGGGAALHFVVYGDTRGDAVTHQSVVDAFAKLDPQLVLHSGDLWDGYTPAEFGTILTKNANIAALLTSNLFLVSRGNHETASAMLSGCVCGISWPVRESSMMRDVFMTRCS